MSVWPFDNLVSVPASARRTVTDLLGAVDSETPNEVLWPFSTVTEDWSVTTLGFSTRMATGSDVVLPCLLVVTAVSE